MTRACFGAVPRFVGGRKHWAHAFPVTPEKTLQLKDRLYHRAKLFEAGPEHRETLPSNAVESDQDTFRQLVLSRDYEISNLWIALPIN